MILEYKKYLAKPNADAIQQNPPNPNDLSQFHVLQKKQQNYFRYVPAVGLYYHNQTFYPTLAAVFQGQQNYPSQPMYNGQPIYPSEPVYQRQPTYPSQDLYQRTSITYPSQLSYTGSQAYPGEPVQLGGSPEYELYGCHHFLVGSLGEIEEERMRASEDQGQQDQSQLEEGEPEYELYGCRHFLVGSLGEIEEERMRASEV